MASREGTRGSFQGSAVSASLSLWRHFEGSSNVGDPMRTCTAEHDTPELEGPGPRNELNPVKAGGTSTTQKERDI